MLCAVKNSPGVRQPINICIAPRDRPVLRSKRLNHSIEIALALVIALTPFVKTLNGRKGLRRSIISARFTRFSRSSTSDGRTGTVPGSKICRTISAGPLSISASACAACSWTCCEKFLALPLLALLLLFVVSCGAFFSIGSVMVFSSRPAFDSWSSCDVTFSGFSYTSNGTEGTSFRIAPLFSARVLRKRVQTAGRRHCPILLVGQKARRARWLRTYRPRISPSMTGTGDRC